MRSLVFEGKTWEVYEQLREQDKKQHQQLCKIRSYALEVLTR
jgi:toxin YoeB